VTLNESSLAAARERLAPAFEYVDRHAGQFVERLQRLGRGAARSEPRRAVTFSNFRPMFRKTSFGSAKARAQYGRSRHQGRRLLPPAVGKAKFPLVGDPTHALTRAFDVHIDAEGLALRGTFIVDPSLKIKTLEIHDNAIARDMKETLRKLKAAQYVASHLGEVCPAKWNEGAKTIAPSLSLVGKI